MYKLGKSERGVYSLSQSGTPSSQSGIRTLETIPSLFVTKQTEVVLDEGGYTDSFSGISRELSLYISA